MSRKRPAKGEAGAPAWMVTFGDLMSLLLTFFILLFSVSEVKQKKIYEVFKSFRVHFDMEVPSMGYHIEPLSDVMGLLAEMALEMPDQKEGKEGKTKVEVENPLGEHRVEFFFMQGGQRTESSLSIRVCALILIIQTVGCTGWRKHIFS